MKNIYLFWVLAILAFSAIACEKVDSDFPGRGNNDNIDPNDMPDVPSEPSSGIFGPKYEGTILAGNEAPYIEFNTEDYEKATEDGKVILLYFYSLQSAPSIADQNAVKDAFDEMINPNIIGFRVNFNDDMTSAAEKALATELSVRIARTKIIMKDGNVVQRSTSDDWNANNYIRQLTQYLD